MKSTTQLVLMTTALLAGGSLTRAHEGHSHVIQAEKTAVMPLPNIVEKKGPVPAPAKLEEKAPFSGQGFWKFVAVPNVLPVPEEAKPFVKGAHGTLIVDEKRDILYWGLQKVGWISFHYKLTQSLIIKGDPAFASGNLHGADLIYRRGQDPLVAVADNEEGEVYLSDTSFSKAEKLDWPAVEPYKSKGEFHPTDVAFTKLGQIYVTDGYGKAFFMPASTDPLKYEGTYIGGKDMSQTPHGITYNKADKSLLVSARPEAQVKHLKALKEKYTWLETMALPAGSTVCDVDIWGDYALAPCLDGPNRTPGPIYIINLKKQAIVSTIKPKEDLGFTEAQHIHDATWYITGKGKKREVYVVFTNWNPGGIGAVKLVNIPD